MTKLHFPVLTCGAMLLLTACSTNGLDWDMRSGARGLDTSSSSTQATSTRPAPDARGVISYPGYKVAVAQPGDTVASVAMRVGISGDELARYNALKPNDVMRGGELLTLPNSASYGTGGAALPGAAGQGGAIDVTTIATTALDRVPSNGAATGTAVPLTQPGAAPVRHLVKRGETAFQIARVYNVSARSLADWNGLGADLEVQEGQYLIIPTANGKPPVVNTNTAPGAGTPTPQPPSAKKPLPAETVAPASQKPKETPKSPDLVENRTEASAAQFAMPVSGKIIRGYSKGKSDGIDIAAPVGTTVKAASSGTVAAITKNTSGTMIVVIKHADKLLTVYGGVDGLTVKKGDKVKRGQSIATVGAGSPSLLHFEVRQGVESLDPMTYLQ